MEIAGKKTKHQVAFPARLWLFLAECWQRPTMLSSNSNGFHFLSICCISGPWRSAWHTGLRLILTAALGASPEVVLLRR